MYTALKIRPFEEFVGEDKAYNYIAIRADEDRVGYKPLKNVEARNIEPKYPFKEDGITERMSTEFWRRAVSAYRSITNGEHAPGATSVSTSAKRSGLG